MENAPFREEQRDGVTIRTRSLGNGITEYIAEGDLDADVHDLEDVLERIPLHPRFMPYVERADVLARRPDGTERVYLKLNFPLWFKSRDYVLDWKRDASSLTSNEFRAHFHSVKGVVPEKAGVIRVPYVDGEWIIRSEGRHRSHVVYRYAVNPGDEDVPAFAEELGRKDGVLKLFHVMQREANLREFRLHAYARDPSERPR